LDEASVDLSAIMSQFPGNTEIQSMGDMIVQVLQDPGLEELVSVTLVESAESARAAVDSQEAGMAVIIPGSFSQQFSSLKGEAEIEIYQDPTLTLGPAIVRSILTQFMDGLSGARITVNVALAQAGSTDPAFFGKIVEKYLTATAAFRDPAALLDVNDTAQNAEEIPLALRIIGPIMGAMLIFYAFYTGTATAETLLAEDELGTLPRLFTTPTRQATILGGKLLAVLLTVSIQVVVLLLLGWLIFQVKWGEMPSVLLFAVGTILVASAFGVCVTSFMKNTKQGGIIFGGVLTFSGMLGMLPIFTMGSTPSPVLKTISFFVPQGWSVDALLQSMQEAPLGSQAFNAVVMLAWAVVFFAIGVWRFQKRYA
jgi:ABC-2 type transport system permease protein